MLTRIELVDFMSHSHTTILPSPGLTVLTGPNNCGKSAVVVALQILANNENSTYVMRHGAKETRVVVETVDGHRVEWTRKRSGGPAYLVDGKRFDRLNQSVPEEVRAALRIAPVASRTDGGGREFDLHFGSQKSPVFLLDEPGTVIAQFFASSSDAEKLVRMQQLHRDKVRLSRSQIQRLEQDRTRIDQELEALAPAESLQEEAAALEREYERLEAASARETDLRRVVAALSRERSARAHADARHTALAKLEPPPELTRTDHLAGLQRELRTSADRLARARLLFDSLLALVEPRSLSDNQALSTTISSIRQAQSQTEADATAAREAGTALEKAREKLAAWVAQTGRCPSCGGELDVEHVIQAVGEHGNG